MEPHPAPPARSVSPSEAELLSQELLISAMVQEVTRVMLTADNLPRTLHTFLLGLGEIVGQRPMAVFGLEGRKFRVESHVDKGLRKRLKDFQPKLEWRSVSECLRRGQHLLVEHAPPDDPFRALETDGYLLVPLRVGHAPEMEGVLESLDHPALPEESTGVACDLPPARCLALLWIDCGSALTPVTGQGISYLLTLAQLASLRIETFRMYRTLEEMNHGLSRTNGKLEQANHSLYLAQRRINDDLERARTIQSSLLPTTLPEARFKALASRYIPAGQVGGDYWDCFELPDGSLGLVMADVSGHGISAALVMTMFKVLLKTFAGICPSPAETLKRVNTTFLEEVGGGRHFVTAFYGLLDPTRSHFTWSNAGHTQQMVCLPGQDEIEIKELESLGLVLGIFPETMITDKTIATPPGTRIVLFTDGIVEAHDATNHMFGNDGLKQVLAEGRSLTAEALAANIMTAWEVHQFGSAEVEKKSAVKGTKLPRELADDATLVILDL